MPHRQYRLSRSRQNSEPSVGLAIKFMHFLITTSGSSSPNNDLKKIRWEGCKKQVPTAGASLHHNRGSCKTFRDSLNNIGYQKGTNVFPRGIPHLNTPKIPNWTWEEIILELVMVVLKLKSWQLGLLLQLLRFLCLNLRTEACRQ